MARRFSASSETTINSFYKLMVELQATSLKINQDVMNNKVEVVFDRIGFRYVFRCEKWGNTNDNLRAIYHSIRFLYKALSEYGVVKNESAFDETFHRVFGGFLATPDDTALLLGDGSQHWSSVLGVDRNTTKEAVRNSFRALSKIHHPDNGGNTDDFIKLRKAYDDAMKEVKK